MRNEPRYRIDRRRFLQVSAAGVTGAVLPFATKATGAIKPRAKSVLIVLLSGGPSQLDTLDPKPNAPAEVRGEFSPIQTAIPGVQFCEHLPRLAKHAQRWAIIRSLAHVEHNHLLATHVALTGRPTPIPRGGSDLDRVESRSDFPNIAAAYDYVRQGSQGVPTGVSLPNYLIEGPLTWPGQHAGFLGPKHDPWQINGDPNDPAFRIDSLGAKQDVTPVRLHSRRELLDELSRGRSSLEGSHRTSSFREQQALAINLLTSTRMNEAFDIQREPADVRDRYGRNKFGQSLLLSRRLLAAGVPVVQATMGIVQTWDTHVDNWGRLKNTLLPQLDQGLEALIEDLSSSGLLDETMVVVMGEFGRTPRVSTLPGETIPGRDHWAHAYSGLFTGAGIQGGQVIGETDAVAAYPLTNPWSPADVLTTLYDALGVSHQATIADPLGRPHHLLNGTVISPLFGGNQA